MQREEQKAEAKEEAKQAPADVIKEDKRLVNSEYNRVASPERAKRDSKQKGPQRGRSENRKFFDIRDEDIEQQINILFKDNPIQFAARSGNKLEEKM